MQIREANAQNILSKKEQANMHYNTIISICWGGDSTHQSHQNCNS